MTLAEFMNFYNIEISKIVYAKTPIEMEEIIQKIKKTYDTVKDKPMPKVHYFKEFENDPIRN